MTTTTLTPTPAARIRPPGALRRIATVARLLLVNKTTVIGIPWLIMGILFLASLAIWWLTSVSANNGELASTENMFIGASSYLVIYMMIVAVQAINLTFPFALGYSVTRRDFYLGCCLAFVVLSLGYTVALSILAWIERATNGWGLGGMMFDYGAISGLTPAAGAYVTLVAFLLFFFLGAAVASMYVRWRMYGLVGFFAALTALLVGSITLVTLTGSWARVGAWFAASGVVGVASWMLVPTLLAAISGYFILRRATPRR